MSSRKVPFENSWKGEFPSVKTSLDAEVVRISFNGRSYASKNSVVPRDILNADATPALNINAFGGDLVEIDTVDEQDLVHDLSVFIHPCFSESASSILSPLEQLRPYLDTAVLQDQMVFPFRKSAFITRIPALPRDKYLQVTEETPIHFIPSVKQLIPMPYQNLISSLNIALDMEVPRVLVTSSALEEMEGVVLRWAQSKGFKVFNMNGSENDFRNEVVKSNPEETILTHLEGNLIAPPSMQGRSPLDLKALFDKYQKHCRMLIALVNGPLYESVKNTFDYPISVSLPDISTRIDLLKVFSLYANISNARGIAQLLAGQSLRTCRFLLRYAIETSSETPPLLTPATIKESIQKSGRGLSFELPNVDYFNDIGGYYDLRCIAAELAIIPFLDPLDATAVWKADPPKGVLFVGPPGWGKTLLAKAIARAVNASVFVTTTSELKSEWYGFSEKNIRALWEKALVSAPSIIIIDEIESLTPKRSELEGQTGQIDKGLVTEFLTMLDGIKETAGVLLIAISNHPEKIDDAMMSRLDPLEYRTNTRKEVKLIYQAIFKNRDVITERFTETQWAEITELSRWFSGRDMDKVVRRALGKRLADGKIAGLSAPHPLSYEELSYQIKLLGKHSYSEDVENMLKVYKRMFPDKDPHPPDDNHWVIRLKDIRKLVIEMGGSVSKESHEFA